MALGVKIAARTARRRTTLASCLLMTTALGGLAIPVAASAQSAGQAATRNFNIPAQSLNDALTDFGQQSGLQVSVDSAAIRGVSSPGVSGSLPPVQALSQLLTGTGFTFRINGNVVTLERAPHSADGAIQLGPIRVEGASESAESATTPPQAVLGNLPPAYAGGQVARGAQLGLLGNRDVMDTPFSQTSYTSQAIQDQQAQTVQDVLANDPSVMSTPKRGGAVAFTFVRGFFDSNFTSGGTLNGLAGMIASQYPSMDYVERVEVLRGPSALLNGMSTVANGSVGGTVNLFTKQASDKPLTEITANYISRSQIGAHVDVGRRFGTENRFGIRFNGTYRQGDTPVHTQSAEVGTASLNLDYRGKRVRLSADIVHEYNRTNPENLEYLNITSVPNFVPAAPDSNTTLSPPTASFRTKSTMGMLRSEVDIIDHLTAYAAIGKRNFDNSRRGTVGYEALVDSTGRYLFYNGAEKYSYRVFSAMAGLRATATTGPVHNAFGLNFSQTKTDLGYLRNLGTSVTISSIYDPVFPSLPSVAEPSKPSKTASYDVSSLGVADTMSILDDRIQVTAGVRHQKVETKNFNASTGAQIAGYDSDAWTPAFGLTVKPWQNLSLYANYIENLQAGTVVGSSYANSGEVFPPYVSKQYEAGAKYDWGTVTTTLAAFRVAQPSTLSVASQTGGLPTLVLNGEQRNRGIELNTYGEVAHGVRLLGGITLLDGRLTKTQNGLYDGHRASGAPEFRAVIGGEWDTPLNGVTLTGRFTHTSEQGVSNTNETLKIPSWDILDLGARFTFQAPWNTQPIAVRFNVGNVFNKNYWTASYSNRLYLGEPRTFSLSMTAKF